MKIILNVFGILLTLLGLVWILQGLNVLLGGMMSGHIQYAILGLVVVIVGMALLVYANRRPRIAGPR